MKNNAVFASAYAMAGIVAMAVVLSACTVFEAPPGGHATVVPGYDYNDPVKQNATGKSEAPVKSDAPASVPNGSPGTPAPDATNR